jgi:hypothetical protein
VHRQSDISGELAPAGRWRISAAGLYYTHNRRIRLLQQGRAKTADAAAIENPAAPFFLAIGLPIKKEVRQPVRTATEESMCEILYHAGALLAGFRRAISPA